MAIVKPKKRENPKSNIGFLLSDGAYDMMCCTGYTTLDKNPEVMTACQKIAEIIGMITIHIYENTKNGDQRIVNALSRKIDIEPCAWLTRKAWIESIIMNLLIYGHGNSVVQVTTSEGRIDDMIPIPPSMVSFAENGYSYNVYINGVKFDPSEVLHFTMNPSRDRPWQGQGVRFSLNDIVPLLKQARYTEKKFLEQPKPSIIVKVDAFTEEFASPEGRDALAKQYVKSNQDGEPWMIPSDQFSVEQVKPLTLSDLAIADNMKLNKQTIAAILGVPSFLLGVGEYSDKAWNNFINTKIKSICTGIQQELTKKLILSPDWYIKFNITSLLDWDLKTISDVFGGLSDRGIVLGNEVRDKLGLSPLEGLNEPRILENYIPLDMIANQKKLIQGDD